MLVNFPYIVDLALTQRRHTDASERRRDRPCHLWLCEEYTHSADVFFEHFGIPRLFRPGTLLGRVDDFGTKEAFKLGIWIQSFGINRKKRPDFGETSRVFCLWF